MTDNSPRPYTIVELEQGRGRALIDVGYLVYDGKKTRLDQTEYAVAMGLLSPEGFQFSLAESERHALSHQPQQTKISITISRQMAANALTSLRRKLKSDFGGELVIPRTVSGGNAKRTQGLRIWTHKEIEALNEKLRIPGDGLVTIQDQHAQWHAFFNGHEIKPSRRSGISDLQKRILEGAATQEGFIAGQSEEQFRPTTVQQALIDLRRLLESQVGMTLTRRVGGINIKPEPVKLVPFRPDDAPKTPPQGRAPAS